MMITESAVATETAAHSVRFAHSVLDHWQSSGGTQPHPKYLNSVHATAVVACDALTKLGPVPIVSTWRTRLGVQHDQSALPLVQPGDWRRFVSEIIDLAFSPSIAAPQTVDRWAMELAALLSEQQRSESQLARQMIRTFTLKANINVDTRTLIEQHLLAIDRPHVALLGVTGARELPGLSAAGRGASLRQLYPGLPKQFRGWGAAGSRGLRFAQGLAAGRIDTGEATLRSVAPHAFVSVGLDAADTRDALMNARAALSEALDQYVVAHPTVRLAVEPVSAVADPTSYASFRIEDLRGKPLDEVTPLVVPWPTKLLIALRMASLMRASAAPLTRAALCWVTLESAGIKPAGNHQVMLGKALSMATLRQMYIRAYRQLVAGSGANSEERRRHERRAANLRSTATRLLELSASVPDVARLRLHGGRLSVQSVLHERIAMLAQQQSLYRQGLLVDLGVAAFPNGYVPAPAGRLNAFTEWAALLRRYFERNGKGKSDDALRYLAVVTTTSNRSLLNHVGVLGSHAVAAVAALNKNARWFEGLVAGLYISRNLHLHSGVHDLEGGVNLSVIGPLAVDNMFEMWAAWYAGGSTSSPIDVLSQLANRFDDCVQRLEHGSLIEELNLGSLTGPDWVPGAGP